MSQYHQLNRMRSQKCDISSMPVHPRGRELLRQKRGKEPLMRLKCLSLRTLFAGLSCGRPTCTVDASWWIHYLSISSVLFPLLGHRLLLTESNLGPGTPVMPVWSSYYPCSWAYATFNTHIIGRNLITSPGMGIKNNKSEPNWIITLF